MAAVLLAMMATSCGGRTAGAAPGEANDAAAIEDSAPTASDAAREAEADAAACVRCDPTADASATQLLDVWLRCGLPSSQACAGNPVTLTFDSAGCLQHVEVGVMSVDPSVVACLALASDLACGSTNYLTSSGVGLCP